MFPSDMYLYSFDPGLHGAGSDGYGGPVAEAFFSIHQT